MSKSILSEGDRKKQASELIKNADKLLKGGDPVAAFDSIQQAIELDPGNLYAQAYCERIKGILQKTGVTLPEEPVRKVQPVVEQPPVQPPSIPATPPPVPSPKAEEPPKPKPQPAPKKKEPEEKLRKLAAIMFTDMVSYTSLAQTNESLAIRLVETQQKLIRPLFQKHDGKEIKTVGDAFLAEFVSVLQAVRCALEIQNSISSRNLKTAKGEQFHLRIGVHLGDIIYKDNDIYGDGVNIASRIQSMAEPGGIYVSQDVYNQIRNRDEFILEYIGEIELKNIITPVPIYKVLTESEIRRKEEEEAVKIATREGIQEAQTMRIEEFLTKAKQLMGKGALQESLIEITKILQISTQHPEARLIESQIRNKRIEIISKQIEQTKRLPHQQMLDLYKDSLQYALKEGPLTPDEIHILHEWRSELQLTDEDHNSLMQSLSKQ